MITANYVPDQNRCPYPELITFEAMCRNRVTQGAPGSSLTIIVPGAGEDGGRSGSKRSALSVPELYTQNSWALRHCIRPEEAQPTYDT